MSKSRIADLLALSYVPRWSVVPCYRQQSVAEHSFRVAALAWELAERLGILGSTTFVGHVLRWGLVHDGPEAESADIPYPFKQSVGGAGIQAAEHEACPWYEREEGLPRPQERLLVKIADKMDEVLWLEQWGSGPKAQVALQSARRQIEDRLQVFKERYAVDAREAVAAIFSEFQLDSGTKLEMLRD